MERDKLIEKGLRALLEKGLEILDYSIRNKDDIVKEVDQYLGSERIAKREGLDISGFHTKYNQIIENFWKIKNGGEYIKNEKEIFN